jgi:hypothetical protein
MLLLALLAGLAIAGCRPAPGKGATLRVAAPEADRDADVYIDGNYVGQINALGAAGTGGLQLAPGVHRVEIRKAGRFPVQRTVTVERNGPDEVTVQAELLTNPE